MSIYEGKDARGIRVNVCDATDQSYLCLYCNVKMHKKMSPKGTLFFCCYPNTEHGTKTCRTLAHTRVTHTVKDMDPGNFFEHIFSTPTAKSSPEGGPVVMSETDIADQDDYELAGPNSSLPSTDADEGIERPFSSLRQIYSEGLSERLRPHDQIAPQKKAMDIFAFKKWWPLCFEKGHFSGGPLVVEAVPDRPLPNYRIRFSCFWKNQMADMADSKSKWCRVYFDVAFKNKSIFRSYVNKTLEKKPDKNGKSSWCSKCESVLIAGNWGQSNDSYSSVSCFCCDFGNRKQIYCAPPSPV